MQEKYYTLLEPRVLMHLLWVLPLIIIVFCWARYKRGVALKIFAGNAGVQIFMGALSKSRRMIKYALVLAAVTLLIFALARPAWNPQEIMAQQKGRDVVFLLDVSNSMLAEDLRPSRLEAAKLAIDESISSIEGDRVGLVAFAGNARILCPLTVDYSFFKTALDKVGVDSVDVGGTILADAVRKILDELLSGSESKNKDIIIITDGGDADAAEDRFAVEVAREAAGMGVRIITIGIGDEKVGKRIPYTNGRGEKVYMQYNGKDIVTKLNADVLRDMAKATIGGAYVNVGTAAFDLSSIYRTLVGSAEKSDIAGSKVTTYTEGFQYVLFIALVLLVVEMVMHECGAKLKSRRGR